MTFGANQPGIISIKEQIDRKKNESRNKDIKE